jgi:hypothetical protein
LIEDRLIIHVFAASINYMQETSCHGRALPAKSNYMAVQVREGEALFKNIFNVYLHFYLQADP